MQNSILRQIEESYNLCQSQLQPLKLYFYFTLFKAPLTLHKIQYLTALQAIFMELYHKVTVNLYARGDGSTRRRPGVL